MANILPSPPLFGLTSGRMIVATGAASVGNSNFTVSGNALDIASAGTITLGGTAIGVNMQAHQTLITGTDIGSGAIPFKIDTTNAYSTALLAIYNQGNLKLHIDSAGGIYAAGWFDTETPGGTINIGQASATTINIGSSVTDIALINSNTIRLWQNNVTHGTDAIDIKGGTITGITASTEQIGININQSATKTWNAGALALQREVSIAAPTYAFASASIITEAATLAINGGPNAGANATITNTWDILLGANTAIGWTASAGPGAAPTYTTRSVGTRIVLDGRVNAGSTEYAIGVESNFLWLMSRGGVKFYMNDLVTANAQITGAGSYLVAPGQALDTLSAGSLFIGNNAATSISYGGGNTTTQSFAASSFITQNTPNFYLIPLTLATSGTQVINSPNHFYRARYWNGTTSVDWEAKLVHVMDTTGPTSHMSLQFNGVEKVSFLSNGNLSLPAGATIDTSTSGALNIGSTATSVSFNLGGSQKALINNFGTYLCLAGNEAIDTLTTGLMKIGTSTATSITVGRPAMASIVATTQSMQFVAAANTGSAPVKLNFNSANDTALTAAIENNAVNFNMNFTREWSAGTTAVQREFLVQAPTYQGATATATFTSAATFAITGPPIAGTNAAITNSFALWVQTGDVGLGANASIKSAVQSATNTTALTIKPDVADGASSIALVLNSATTMSSGLIAQIQNGGTRVGAISKALIQPSGMRIQGDTGNTYLELSSASTYLGFGSTTLQVTTGQVIANGTLVANGSSVPVSDAGAALGALSTQWSAVYAYAYNTKAQSITAAASNAINPASGSFVKLNLQSATNVTSMTISAGTDGQELVVQVIQPAAGTAATMVTSWTNVSFAGGAGSFTPTLGKRDVYSFIYDATTSKWRELGRAINQTN